MSYDAEARERAGSVVGALALVAPMTRKVMDVAIDEIRQQITAAYAAGERAGAERMREQAVAWHRKRERAEASCARDAEEAGGAHMEFFVRSLLHYHAAQVIEALPLDGGDDA